ncbi:MAG: hypothetical protein ACOH19_15870 [Rhodoglobus sp.]
MTQNEAGRYGASLTAFILGGYAIVSVNLGYLFQFFRGPAGPEAFSQVTIALVIIVAAIVLHPASGFLRGIAVALVVLGMVLLLFYQISYLSGDVSVPRELGMVARVILRWDSVMVTLLLAAWFIVRRSNPLAFVFLPLTVIIGLIGTFLLIQGVEGPVTTNITLFVSLLVAVGIAWIGAALSRGRRDRPVQPHIPNRTPEPGAAYGPIVTGEGQPPVPDPYPPVR